MQHTEPRRVLIAGESWSVSSLVGLIGLFGIAVQNGLVLVTQTRGLITEGKPFNEALREACIGRVRPKIMTAATAILVAAGFDGFGIAPEVWSAVVLGAAEVAGTLARDQAERAQGRPVALEQARELPLVAGLHAVQADHGLGAGHAGLLD